MFSSNTSQVDGPAPTDPQFNYVTMLLPGNGTNGAQNNTFVDSSTNNFTITRNGNTTQGTFSPYGSLWSNFFDGSGDWLQIAHSAALDFYGSDFTLEMWANFARMPTDWSNGMVLISKGDDQGDGWSVWFGPDAGAPGGYSITINSFATGHLSAKFSTAPAAGQWYHFAFSRTGSSSKAFINGVEAGTGSGTTWPDDSTLDVRIGRMRRDDYPYFTQGYISNLRLVKGTGLYSSNFTPSTTPLTAVTNTTLLTCQSNRFIDNSTNNFTITANGNTSIQRFSPFAPTAPYSAATIGGSMYFDGTGDFLSFPQNTAQLSNSDFSVEAWVYPLSSGNIEMLIGNTDDTTIAGSSYVFYAQRAGNNSFMFFGGNNVQIAAPAPIQNAWNHIVYARTSGTWSCFLNGTRVSTASANVTVQNGASNFPPSINRSGGSSCYMAGYRFLLGSSAYDATLSTLTVPTTIPTAITNTRYLLNLTNAGIIDNAMMNDLETVGNAQISTAQAKFGTGSLSVNGSSGYLRAPQSEQFRFGTSDFTIEGWFYLTSSNSSQCIVDFRPSSGSSTGFFIGVVTGGYFQIWAGTNVVYVDAGIGLNQWYYFAVSRSGSTLKAFLNGSEIASVANSTNWTDRNLSIGFSASGAEGLTGYIDDLRITKAARYTANFTPPAAPFPTN